MKKTLLLPCSIFFVVATNYTVAQQLNFGGNRILHITGGNNLFLGLGSGNGITSGLHNTFVGISSGRITNGTFNTFIGTNTGYSNTTGNSNTFIGSLAGEANTEGANNVMIGNYAGYLSKTGESNVMIGYNAGRTNNSGSLNDFIGINAGYNNTTGGQNVFLGSLSGYQNKTGGLNTYLGGYSGANNVDGNKNTFIGFNAGFLTTSSNNSFLGYQSGYSNTSGENNVFLGYQAGFKNNTANANVFIGYQTGYSNTTGTGNLFMGNQAGAASNGSYNLFIGNGSGGNNISGLGNTFIGDGSGYGNAYGQNNTYIGRAANFSGNAFGSQNTFIGFQARTGGGNVNNATAIGVNAIVTQDNSVVLGAPGTKVGIGNSAPNNTVEITQGTSGQSGLRLTNLTSNSPASVTNYYKFLTVNSNGDVILASNNASTREGVSETLWERKGSFLQSVQNDAVIIGTNVARTPSGYKLFVEEGILTEKVKVAVKNTSEWSDYVFKPGYSLKPLSEVEHYIQAHAHLPGVPSAKEMVEKGNDLHKTDAKLLEKIEELTLYSIQLEKDAKVEKKNHQQAQQQIQHLQTEVSELKALVKQLLEKK